MSRDTKENIAIFLISASVTFGLMSIVEYNSMKYVEKQAIALGFAYHHPKTGNFTWDTNLVVKELKK